MAGTQLQLGKCDKGLKNCQTLLVPGYPTAQALLGMGERLEAGVRREEWG